MEIISSENLHYIRIETNHILHVFRVSDVGSRREGQTNGHNRRERKRETLQRRLEVKEREREREREREGERERERERRRV